MGEPRPEHESAPVSGLAGVLIWTDAERFPAMRDFYVQTLGLRPRSDRERFVSFVLDPEHDIRLSISVHTGIAGAARDPLRVMVNFRVDDIDAATRRLRDAGVAFERPPEREPWGGVVATFRDPDGNVLQLMELPRPD